jgi:membrane dipeptidase
MKTNRRRFLARVSAAGAVVAVGPMLDASLGQAARPADVQAAPPDRPGGTHSIVSRELPHIFIDPCMQIWPDADLTTAHRHGVTAYGVTAWDPNVTVDVALKGLMSWRLAARRHPNLLVVERPEDIRRAKKEGKAGLLLAAQDGDWIGKELHRIEAFQRLGLRMMLVAYNRGNNIADGCLDRTNHGLTRFGELVVDECNRVGIVLDCSHLGRRSALDVIERSQRPCVFSHSNPAALVPNPRNIDDDLITRCAARGGVVCLVTWGPLVMKPGSNRRPAVDDFIDLVDHVVRLTGGTNHIGVSTDMSIGTYPAHERDPWGDPEYPNPAAEYDKVVTADTRSPRRNIEGFDDYAQVGSLTDRLQARGYSLADVERLLGGNLLRVFEEVWV